MSDPRVSLAAATCLAGLIIALPAWGSSGGMMGNMSGGMTGGAGVTPSLEAPRYNLVEEFQKGEAAYQAGRFKEAANHFEHVTDAQPGVAAAWFRLGEAREAGGDVKGSIRPFEKAAKLDPKSVEATREYAISLAKAGQTAKAKSQLDGLQARIDKCGAGCDAAVDLKAAVDAVNAALAASAPPRPVAALDAADRDRPGALMFASNAEGDAAYLRAVSLINRRRYDEALAALGRAQLAFGPHPDILTYQGYVWRKLGRLDKAEGFYRAALSVEPRHIGAMEYYGELKVVRGDIAGARELLARLDRACVYGCAEVDELRRWIDRGGDPSS